MLYLSLELEAVSQNQPDGTVVDGGETASYYLNGRDVFYDITKEYLIGTSLIPSQRA